MAKKIYIDAGHGGYDPGAVKGDRKEADDTLSLVLKIAELLEDQPCEVILSRESDRYMSINDRCNRANSLKADYFLSVHRNSGSASATGNEIWVYSEANSSTFSKAFNIITAVCKADGLKNRGTKKGAAFYTDFGVNRYTNMPSALLELGFISNDSDNEVFDSKFNDIALAVAKTLLNAVGEEWEEKGDVNADGKVNAADARKTLRASAKLEKFSEKEKSAADMNKDGKVTAADARDILKKASGVE